MDLVIIFVCQLLFQLSRTYGQRVVSRDNALQATLVSSIIMVLWLVTTGMGVKFFNDMNVWGILSYLTGGVLGVYLSFKIPIKE